MGNFAKTDLQNPAMPLPFVWGLLQGNLLSETGLIHCDVVFGSPRSDCSGAGICKIVDINSNQQPQLKRTCRLAPALLTADAAGNTLTMTFLRQFMCVHLLRHHFRTGILKVQDACAIPERVVEKMGLSGSAIVPGHYTIEENRWGFKILFSV